LPQHSKEFQSQEYWKQFFADNVNRSELQNFEWYADFVDMEALLKLLIPTGSKVLVPGCGDSLLSEQVAGAIKDLKVLSFDFEPEVVQRMSAKSKLVDYRVMDMLKMDLENAS
jgi:RAT1-interacting protein